MGFYNEFKNGFREASYLNGIEYSMKGPVGWFLELVFHALRIVILAMVIFYFMNFTKVIMNWRNAVLLALILEITILPLELEYYTSSSIEMKARAVAKVFAQIVVDSIKLATLVGVVWLFSK